jgi:hypothetical protein
MERALPCNGPEAAMKENQRDQQSPTVRNLRLIKGGLWGLTPKTATAAGHRIPKLKLVGDVMAKPVTNEARGGKRRVRDLAVKPRAGANTKGGGGPNLMLACATGQYLKEVTITKAPTITS